MTHESGSIHQEVRSVDAVLVRDPRVRYTRRALMIVVGLQAGLLAALIVGGSGLPQSVWTFVAQRASGIYDVGGLATGPLLICIGALAVAVASLTLDRLSVLRLSRAQRTWCDRTLVYAGRVAWMLGLLQTMLSLYEIRFVFEARLEYEAMVEQLGKISGTAYGSSLIGGGTLLAGWIAQLALTGRLRD